MVNIDNNNEMNGTRIINNINDYSLSAIGRLRYMLTVVL